MRGPDKAKRANELAVIHAAIQEHGHPPDPWHETFIYFMQMDCPNGPIKIGQAKNPILRQRELQCGNPYPLILRRAVITQPSNEHWLHRMFSPVRLVGEWFKPHPSLATLADAIPDPSLANITITMDCWAPEEGERAQALVADIRADIREGRAFPTSQPNPQPVSATQWRHRTITFRPEPDENGWRNSSADVA